MRGQFRRIVCIAVVCGALLAASGRSVDAAAACPIPAGAYTPGADFTRYFNTTSVSRPGFTVSITSAHAVLTDLHANSSVCVYLCNTPAPTLPGNPRCFEVPVASAAVADPSLAVFLTRLGVDSLLVNAADSEEIVDPCLQARLKAGSINETADAEVVFTLHSNVTGYNTSRVVPLSILAEVDPLEREEWLNFIAPFFLVNPRVVLNKVINDYNCSSDNMMNARPKPKVAWLSRAADGNFQAGTAYEERLIKDAGLLTYPAYKKTYNSTYLAEALKTADIVIDSTGNVSSLADFMSTYGFADGGLASPYPFLKNKMVFRTDRIVNDAGMSEYDVEGLARPEDILLDLIDMAYETYQKGLTKRYLRNIAKSDEQFTLSQADCPNPSNPPARRDTTCPTNPFDGAAPVPAWTTTPPSTGNSAGQDGPNDGTDGGDNTDGTTDAAPAPPTLSSGKIAGIVIGTVLGVALAAGLVLGVLKYKGRDVLPNLSPRPKKTMDPQTPGSGTGFADYGGGAEGRYREMRDGEVVLPAGAATDNYSQLELYTLEADEN